MRKNQLCGGLRVKWMAPRQHLIQGDAQGIKICTIIQLRIHPPGLFRGDVAESPFNIFKSGPQHLFMHEHGGDSEVQQHYPAGLRVVHDIGRIYIFVDDARFVYVPQGHHQLFCDPVEIRHLQGALFQQPAQRDSRTEFLHQIAAPVQRDFTIRLYHIRAVDPLHDLIFLPQPRCFLLRHGLLASGLKHHPVAGAAVLSAQQLAGRRYIYHF